MFLLDTNVVSELRAGKAKPSPAVLHWAQRVPGKQMYLSAVTVSELEIGVLLMERRDRRQGAVLRLWLTTVLDKFAERVVPFQTTTAILCAALHVPDRKPERDAMIAATAREHGQTLVTRNTGDFVGCGVTLLNPWEDPLQ